MVGAYLNCAALVVLASYTLNGLSVVFSNWEQSAILDPVAFSLYS